MMQLQKKLCDTFKVRCEKCIVNIAEMKSPYIGKSDLREVWLPTVHWSQQTACLPKQFERGLEQLSLCKIGWHAMLLADLHMQTSFPSFPFLTLRSILVGILKRGRSTAFSANLHTVEILRLASKKGGFRGNTFIQTLSPNMGWIQSRLKRIESIINELCMNMLAPILHS